MAADALDGLAAVVNGMGKKIRLEEDEREPDNTDIADIEEALDDDEDADEAAEHDDDGGGEEINFARGERGATLRSRQDLPRRRIEVL